MNQSTFEIRSKHCKSIIEACMSRPSGITAKQWLADNNISDKSYYYWLRKFRKQSYESMSDSTDAVSLLAVSETSNNEVTFAEVPFQTHTETTMNCDPAYSRNKSHSQAHHRKSSQLLLIFLHCHDAHWHIL